MGKNRGEERAVFVFLRFCVECGGVEFGLVGLVGWSRDFGWLGLGLVGWLVGDPWEFGSMFGWRSIKLVGWLVRFLWIIGEVEMSREVRMDS